MRSPQEPKRSDGERANSMPGSRTDVRGLRMRSGGLARATPSCWRGKATNAAFLLGEGKNPGGSAPAREGRSAAPPTRESGLSPREAPAGAVGRGAVGRVKHDG